MSVSNIQMLYYDRIDMIDCEGGDINKTSESKKCDV